MLGFDNADVTPSSDEKIRRFGRVLHESTAAVKLFPMPLSTWEAGILIHIEQ